MDIFNNIVFTLFVIIFCIGVVVNLVGPQGIVESYKRWGLPGWFRYVTAAVEALSVVLVFTYFELLGYALALGVMGGAMVILIFNREYKPVIAPFLTSVIIIFLLK